MAREQVQFAEIDPSSLTEAQQEAWKFFLEAKEAFKVTLQTSAPQGYRVLFSDKYNKLKLGLAKVAAQSTPKSVGNLGDWLAAQAASGRNA